MGEMQNFCYIVEDGEEALIIDPGWEPEKILSEVKGRVVGIVLTHSHFDHAQELDKIKEKTNAPVLGYLTNPLADKKLKEGEKIQVGEIALEVIYTPGHTSDSICLLCDGNLFTGDTVFVEAYGRTDLGGSEAELEQSINRIRMLPKDTVIYPGHNYGGKKITVDERWQL